MLADQRPFDRIRPQHRMLELSVLVLPRRAPVVARAGQDHPDHPAVARFRRRPKEHIHGRSVTVLARADGQSDMTILDYQMVVRWSYEASAPSELPGANLIFDGLAAV